MGAYLIAEAATYDDNNWQIGSVMLGLGALPAVGLGGVWYLKRRRARQPSPRRPAGPVAFSREPIPAGLRFAVLRRGVTDWTALVAHPRGDGCELAAGVFPTHLQRQPGLGRDPQRP